MNMKRKRIDVPDQLLYDILHMQLKKSDTIDAKISEAYEIIRARSMAGESAGKEETVSKM